MTIEPLQPQDLQFLAELTPEGWPDITSAFSFYLKSFHCHPIKVVHNNSIAGVGAEVIHGNIAWLAHIIVDKSVRNQGIGRLITQALVKSVHAKGCETINLIATDLGAPVYEKVGFETETKYLFYKDVNLKHFLSSSDKIIPYDPGYRDQVAELDKAVSGENRFFFITPHLKDSFIYLQGDSVEGYYISTLGEGLIIAKSEEAGIELVKLRLKARNNASFPISNIALNNYFTRHNITPFKTARRMRLGPVKEWHSQFIFNRIGGNVG